LDFILKFKCTAEINVFYHVLRARTQIDGH